MSSSDVADAVNALFGQASEQVDRGNDAFAVACALAPERIDGLDDARADWHHQYALDAHIRAMVYWRLVDCKMTELHRFLQEDDHARTLGYDPEKFADGNTAPSYSAINRAWNEYFGDDLRRLVEELDRHIREYARERGNLLGSQTIRTEDVEGTSERTEYRVKRRLAHEMIERFRDLFYDEIDLNLPDEAHFEKRDLLDFFLHIALTGDFANNGAKTWREEVDDESTAPSGDTFRDYIRLFDELEESEVSRMFEEVSELLWSLADRHGYLDNLADAAVDGHAWLYYGDSDTPRVSSVDPDRGTDKAYKFLTLSVVGDEGEKFTLAVRQVASKQEELEAVKDLVEEANDRLFLRDVFLDRGFYGTLYAQALGETGANFVMRAQKGYKSKQMWEEAEDGVCVERNVEMSRSYAPYESVTITRFVVEAREDIDDEYVAFITNRDLTERQARRVGETYRRRWGIETSYRVTDDFLPKTASKDVALREFYYEMAVLLYNVYVLLNAVVAESLGLPRDASPPVTAKYLLIVMRNKHRGDDAVT